MQQTRHFVNGVDVGHGNHATGLHVGEQRNFFALFLGNETVSTAKQRIGLDTDLAQFLDGVLSGLGFEFAGGGNPGQIGQVHKSRLMRAELETELTRSFKERQRFDVTHRATDFNDGHIDGIGRPFACTSANEFLNFSCDVGDDLNRLAQIVTAPLFLEHTFVNLTGGEVVAFAHARFDETLVVPQIKVGFGTVVGDEHFAVLKRRHGAWVDVEIRVKLDEGDLEAARLEQRSKGSGGDALTKGRHHTTGNKDVLGHFGGRSKACIRWKFQLYEPCSLIPRFRVGSVTVRRHFCAGEAHLAYKTRPTGRFSCLPLLFSRANTWYWA